MKAALAIIFAIAAGVLNAQTQPAFEVAAIRPSGPHEHMTCGQYLPGGRFNVAGCRLIYIIAAAYNLRYYQAVDAPKWAAEGDSSRFNIQAEAGNAAGKDQIDLMLQTLLAERFHLRVHREMRPLAVYVLVAGKDGSRLQPAKDNGKPRGSGGIEWVDVGWLRGTNVFLPFLADSLGSQLDRPVVNQTNIAGAVDFNLRWAPNEKVDDTQPSIFTAVQEQLGLKLEPQKLPIEVLVIDHVERPTPN